MCLWSCHILHTVADHVEDTERKSGVQESPNVKENDETLGEVNHNHIPHGKENMSVVKEPTHSKSGVLQKAIIYVTITNS